MMCEHVKMNGRNQIKEGRKFCQTANPSLSSPLSWYLGGDRCSGNVGRGAVLSGRHATVLFLLILLLTLHALVLCLAAWWTVRWRWKGRWWRWQVFQFICSLLYLHHCIPQKVDCVWQRRQDELEAFLEVRMESGEVYKEDEDISDRNTN